MRPDEVLGLTFTRKAAGELSERLTTRLATLHEAGLSATSPNVHSLREPSAASSTIARAPAGAASTTSRAKFMDAGG